VTRRLAPLPLLCLAILALVLPGRAQAAPKTMTPVLDGFVNAAAPKNNFGTRRKLRVRARPSVRTVMAFDLGADRRAIVAAALWVHVSGAAKGHLLVHRGLLRKMNERRLDWKRRPQLRNGGAVRSPKVRRGHWMVLDVTRLVPYADRMLLVLTASRRGNISMASKEMGARYAPRLVLWREGDGDPNLGSPQNRLDADPSGERMPSTDPAGWRRVFSDDFGATISRGAFAASQSSRWSAYPSPWKDTSGHGTYDPSAISQAGGLLTVHIADRHVAAPVPRLPTMTYGRYAVRFRADPLPGYKTAWLLWPDSGVWPRDGEIDFPEGDLNSTINGYVHHMNGKGGSDTDNFKTSALYTDWHTAIIEWTAGRVNFILDGQTIGSTTTRVPSTPMHWVLQTETALKGPAPSPSTAGDVQIDWVVAWAPA
jgi:hypothetical protein